ncbi:uncharacterized protein LOC113204391 [Frankliniella occidentalis]|uniref:Uncharacterized protein LOC113204391 n=1 Tax=Frankliniella occidentalis TaxID=133901 RepID=A0A9C6U0P1_FRAOC|nr:uncharacterized protein LOC113204391 [Frankliniella occidentalis]
MPSIKKPHPTEDEAATRAALQRQETLTKMAEERYLFEKRVLTSCTAGIVIIAVLWTVALSTDHWYDLQPESGGIFLRDSRTVLRSGHTGLWRLCSEQFHPTNLTAYESITTTMAPVSTTKRPRAQPCKWMGLRGRKRKRCRQFITNRFKFGLAARRRGSALRLNIPQQPPQPGATPGPTAPTDPAAPVDPADPAAPTPELTTPGTPLDYDWLKNDFDEQVSHADDGAGSPDPVDDEVNLEPVDAESEKVLHMVEEEILERISDGQDDNLTVNQTLAEVLDETIQEISDVTFRDCRVRELSENDYQVQGMGVEWQMLSYMRTLVTFSVVSILLLVLGFLSALYTFKEPRYTFKRLSAGIQFIAFCGLLVVIEVFRKAAEYEQITQLGGVPLVMGYSQVLAWVSLAGQILSSFFFLLYSRKKKRNKAPNEEVAMADEPTIIGR